MLKQLLCASLLGLTTLSASSAELAPTLGEDSAYTVTEVTGAGENTILTYEIDKATNALTPHYYMIDLRDEWGAVGEADTVPLYYKWEETDGSYKLVAGTADDHDLTYYMATDYGEAEASGKTAVYYKWQDDGSGGRTLVSGSSGDHDIVFWKDPTKNYDRITTDQGGADIDHGFAGLTSSSDGGAIYNYRGTIGSITGDFIGNSSTITVSNRVYAGGGAIYNNKCEIGDITGDFIGNIANTSSYDENGGGAIYNYRGTIGDITGDFIGNIANDASSFLYSGGGAIYNNIGEIGDITGDFIGNIANTSSSPGTSGGAIFNSGKISSITGDFIGNSASNDGGAIENSDYSNITIGIIGNITGDFIGNSAGDSGGAIYIWGGAIVDIKGDFIGNSAGGSGGAISGSPDQITGDFIGNSAGDDGGAISGSPDQITGDFIGNSAGGSGGAIYNDNYSTIGDITGDFIGNSAGTSGGAIYNDNYSTIGDITGDFIGNSGNSGGAIYNYYRGEIGNITGDFIGNSAVGENAKGGAIYNGNNSDITLSTGDKDMIFKGNFTADSQNPDGTYVNQKFNAVYNSGTINLKAGSHSIIFYDGFAAEEDSNLNILSGDVKFFGDDNSLGHLTIASEDDSNISLDFVNNKIRQIDTTSLILSSNLNLGIDVDLANEVSDRINTLYGGSINNASIILENLNILSDLGDAEEAALNVINGAELPMEISSGVDSFLTTNYKYDISSHYGDNGSYLIVKKDGINLGLPGAIKENGNVSYSQTEDENIGEWIVSSNVWSDKFTLNGNGHKITGVGGINGLYLSDGRTMDINNANFSGFVSETGGAINSAGNLSVTGSSFTENKAISGGALNIGKPIPEVDLSDGIGVAQIFKFTYGDESISYVEPVSDDFSIYNGNNFVIIQNPPVQDEQGFNEQKQDIQRLIASGEVFGSISDMPVSDTPNVQVDEAKEILAGYLIFDGLAGMSFTYDGEELGTLYVKEISDFYSFGLYNPNATGGSIDVEIADTLFSGNIAENTTGDALGGAVSILEGDVFTIQDLREQLLAEIKDDPEYSDYFEGFELSNQFATKEEALAALDEMIASGDYTTDPGNTFSDEYVIEVPTPNVTFVNSKFINNKAVAENGEAKGGAIYSQTDFTVKADGGESVFSGNTANGESNAIYLDNSEKTLSLVSEHKGKILFDDKIDGVNGYKVNITGDDTKSAVILNNNVDNAVVNSENIALTLGKANVFENSDFTITSGALSLMNGIAEQQIMKSANIAGTIDLALDVDLANEVMDRLPANVVVAPDAAINVNNLQIISKTDKESVAIAFAPDAYADQVAFTGKNPVAYSPIYKYNIDYEARENDGGYFLFSRGNGSSGGGNPSDAFNPAVLNTPVANLAAGQATINETFKYVFEHADAFTQLPAVERMAQIKNDYYALSTDYNTNLGGMGNLAPEFHNDGAWVRPYVTFESMNLKNGPDVDAITYGTLIGFDSDFEDFGHGWTGVTTGYVGYNGSQLSYSGNDTSMNGGLLGVTQTFYKGDFWTALTASAGASVGETSTMYGSEDFTSLLAGIGSKTGYNFEFKEGKYILQPIMFLSYTFVNTFDYTNAAGVKIESDPLHTIQLNPSVRFIANLKDGWQPYASVGMVWNLLNQTDTTANGISLPDMHVKPYVEYGIGVQKRWADKFTAFFQTMIRNGGRNGVALTGGFRWSLGKDPDETVNNVNKVKKVIKTLDTKVAGK